MSLENNNNNGKDNNNKNNKNNKKKSIYQIMDKQGFYIILILCIGVVAATSLWVSNQGSEDFIGEGPSNPFGEEQSEPEVKLVEENASENDEGDAEEAGRIGEGKPDETEETEEPSDVADEDMTDEEANDNQEETSNISQGAEQPQPTEEPDQSTESTDEVEKDNEEAEETSEQEVSEEVAADVELAMPVTGEVTLPFADDKLVYHKTLDQWATHKGMDIKASEGSPVKAALDGEVAEVVNDTIIGITITLAHEDDLYTRYSNLSTDAMVSLGDKVTAGQTISGVGKTAANKTLEGPVLHFQVLKGDKFVDPEMYLGDLDI